MVDKKPAKPAPDTTAMKPIAVPANVLRHSIPSLSPIPGEKPAAANVQPVAPVATTAAPEKANQPASTDAKPAAAPASPAKPTESLGPKLRAKAEIIAALRAGAHVLHTETGLYRIAAADGSLNPASKRRILAFIQQGILKVSGEGNGRVYVLDAEAEKKATAEKKPSAKPEASTSKTEEKK